MNVNYIYNTIGKIEYVVVPFPLWDRMKDYAEKIEDNNAIKKEEFNPSEFRGMLSHHDFDIEQELLNMKDQWTRNI